jgi:zinc protease
MHCPAIAALLITVLSGLTPSQIEAQDLTDPIPADPQVTINTLENGLRYYIRVNRKPTNRASLWLVVNAGSNLEDEDQQGLAHFLEHMAFNSTANFPQEQVVQYLQSIGLGGPDFNAFTSFDETVYFLQVPTDDDEALTTVFQILEDWAHNITFDPDEVKKERGVVIEEARLLGDAFGRVANQLLPLLYQGSRYAERLPIGQVATIDTFQIERLESFYRDWYRPELMAVIAVGDFDPAAIEAQIREHFSRLPATENGRPRPTFPVPNHREPIFGIATDPELPIAAVQVSYKRDVPERSTVAALRRGLVEQFASAILALRLDGLTTLADSPFSFVVTFEDRLRTKEAHTFVAIPGAAGIEAALDGLLTEIEIARRFGFTESEFARQKKELLRLYQQAFNERDQTSSDLLAARYMTHYLQGDGIPSADLAWELAQRFIAAIDKAEVNQTIRQLLGQDNRAILISAPEDSDTPVPNADDLRALLERIETKDLQPYDEDDLSDIPLIAQIPTPVSITAERQIPELAVTEWVLENGSRVVLKPTTFLNDEILFTAHSPGGHSLATDADYLAAWTAAEVVAEAGLGTFDQSDLTKKLAGQLVQVYPWIEELQEGLSGFAAPEDAETLFQLIYLYFTAPRQDELAFLSLQSRWRTLLENADAVPEQTFSDTLQAILTQGHLRGRPLDLDLLQQMDLEKSLAFYRNRFGDAGDFTFFFVGNFDLEEMRPLVETYLGPLPADGRQETWQDVEIQAPRGVIKKTVHQGIKSRSSTAVVFSGELDWSLPNRFELDALTALLNIRLFDALRQDLGATYAVFTEGFALRFPQPSYEVSIFFDSAPENAERLGRRRLCPDRHPATPGPLYRRPDRSATTTTAPARNRFAGKWVLALRARRDLFSRR